MVAIDSRIMDFDVLIGKTSYKVIDDTLVESLALIRDQRDVFKMGNDIVELFQCLAIERILIDGDDIGPAAQIVVHVVPSWIKGQ